MPAPTDTQIKLRIGEALNDPLVPVACQVVENIRTSVRTIDNLPSVAIEALLKYKQANHRNDHPSTELDKAYRRLRTALISYFEVALLEVRMKELRKQV